jgi:hypothetical protein
MPDLRCFSTAPGHIPDFGSLLFRRTLQRPADKSFVSGKEAARTKVDTGG